MIFSEHDARNQSIIHNCPLLQCQHITLGGQTQTAESSRPKCQPSCSHQAPHCGPCVPGVSFRAYRTGANLPSAEITGSWRITCDRQPNMGATTYCEPGERTQQGAGDQYCGGSGWFVSCTAGECYLRNLHKTRPRGQSCGQEWNTEDWRSHPGGKY